MKWMIESSHIFIVIAIIFGVMGIMLLGLALNGMAVAIPFFTKLLFVLSFICFVVAFVCYRIKRKVKIKIEGK